MTQIITSSLVEKQLPEFVREDYPKFVSFLEKYYEWLQTNNQILSAIQDFSNSKDIDLASDFYLDIIKKELSPYFIKQN
jgi:hypothetical protein